MALERGPWRRQWRWSIAVVLLGLVGYVATGLFTVSADEQAVVRRFGRISARLGPGIHYRLPWPVDRVDVLKTTTVMKRGVGFDLPEGEARGVTGLELLTGDTNIVSVALAVQYVIANPVSYLVEVEAPSPLISRVAESVLTEVVVGMSVDEVLTTGRLAIQERVKSGTQEILDRYRTGIQITSASIMTITFDGAVAQAFQDVASAGADRENKINEARTYANNVLPKARGEAQSSELRATANSASPRRSATARGFWSCSPSTARRPRSHAAACTSKRWRRSCPR